MNKPLEWSGRVLAVVCLAMVAYRMYFAWPALTDSVRPAGLVVFLILGTSFHIGTILISAFTWCVIMQSLQTGSRITFRQSFSIVGRSQIAKYLPGNVFHYVGRVGLGRSLGLQTEQIIVSTAIDVLLLLTVAFAFGLTGWSFLTPLRTFVESYGGRWWIVLVTGAAAVATLILVIPRVRSFVGRPAVHFSPKAIGLSIALDVAVFLGFGILIAFGFRLIGGLAGNVSWYHLATAFSLAWAVGFVTPGSPGGLGVREFVFIQLLEGATDVSLLVAITVGLRIVNMVGDLLSFGLAIHCRPVRDLVKS